MSILSHQSIMERLFRDNPQGQILIEPCVPASRQHNGMSYGPSHCGYDIRLGWINDDEGNKKEACWLNRGEFRLASAFERVRIPNDLCAQVLDKSSWARKGLAVQNTIIEPGWEGYLTLELTNHDKHAIRLMRGMPIAQLVFQKLDQPTDKPYKGKYQNQPDAPTEAINQD